MLAIIEKILVVFGMAGVGLGANKLGKMPLKANDYFIPLLMNIATPCLLISTTASRELNHDLMINTLVCLGGSLLYFIIGSVICYYLTGIPRLKGENRGVYICCMTLVNNGFMGIPLAQLIFGSEAAYYMILCNIVLATWNYTAGFRLITIGSKDDEKKGLKDTLKSLVNSCTVGAFIGLFLLFTGIRLPALISQIIDYLAQLCIPLSMIVLGVQLGESDLKGLIRRSDVWISSLTKNLILPILVTVIVYFTDLPGLVRVCLVMSAAFPSAVAVTAVAAIKGKNATLSSELIAHSTAFSILTIPFFAFMVSKLFL